MKVVRTVLLIAIVVGLLDATYLYYSYLTASPLNCFLFDGCSAVSASPYSKPLGIPLSLFGLIYYLGMLGLFAIYNKTYNSKIKNLLFFGGLAGFLMSLYFIYIQGFIIQAFCIYCVISALMSMVIFCCLIYLRGLQNNTPHGGDVTFSN